MDDATAIAAIHVRTWQVAYRGIVPSEVLDAQSLEEREQWWRRALERRNPETWVAEDGHQMLGWISAARSRDADALPSTGEVWAIYVAPTY